tara:strand:+ start:107 stop:856 length:750 start_codon:yes stop_codon:yes gene_type:complete
MKINIVVIFILLFNFNAYAQQHDIPFKKGEKLEYKIHFGRISAGIASFEVKTFQNQFKFIATGKSTRIFSLFFNVKDHYESIVDKNSLNPNRFYRNVKEGGYEKIENVFFNYELRQTETTRDTIPLPENTQDLLSILYYLRAQDFSKLKVADSIAVQVYLDDNFLNSQLYYLGNDTIKTKFGWIATTKWAPELETGRVFEEDNGMNLWVSDDENQIPLKIQAKVLVGSIEMDLIKHSGLKEPLKFTKKN